MMKETQSSLTFDDGYVPNEPKEIERKGPLYELCPFRPGYVPRDYQDRGVDKVMKQFETVNATLVEWATGTGKTELIIDVARRCMPLYGRVLFVAHTIELVSQSAQRFYKRLGIMPDIEQGDLRANESIYGRSPIVCASKDSLHEKRLEGRFRNVGLLVIDEAHRTGGGLNKSYMRIITHLRKQNPNLKILGVTATAKRHDGKRMGRLFESVADQIGLREAIDDGWLVEPIMSIFPVRHMDFGDVRKVAGDLEPGKAARIMERDNVCYEIADIAVQEGADRLKTLGFARSVAQAEKMSWIFNDAYDIPSAFISGDRKQFPKEKRHEIFEAYKKGEIKCLWNCALVVEGVDLPGLIDPVTGEVIDAGVEHVVMGKPSLSRSAVTQMIGRGTRPIPGVVDGLDLARQRRIAIANSLKPNVKVTDLYDNSTRHNLVTCSDILSGSDEDAAIVKRAMVKRKTPMTRMEMEAFVQKEKIRQRHKDERKKKQREERAALRAKVCYERMQVNPFDNFGNRVANPKNVRTITPNQIGYLKMRGWQGARKLTFQEARTIIMRCERGEPIARMQREWDAAETRRNVRYAQQKIVAAANRAFDMARDFLKPGL